MATALSNRVVVRAPAPGEGKQVAELWRQLWDLHTVWGGYPGSAEPSVYQTVADRIDSEARYRVQHGQTASPGPHLHVVAVRDDGCVVGQVEGWLERYGARPQTPATCEVRSLVVHQRERGCGFGVSLLAELARLAHRIARGPVVLAAEVFEANPAQRFYARANYLPVSYTLRLEAPPLGGLEGDNCARAAGPFDAFPVALLDGVLASRRRACGDQRFDGPAPVDASLASAIATHLVNIRHEPSELVVVDVGGNVRASASLSVATLEPPFLVQRRGVLGRFAVDPTFAPKDALQVLLPLGFELARCRGARTLELTDLTAPSSKLNDAAREAGATPWSRIVTRLIADSATP
jgi:GNAT superfamily N-acetyltransferase